jgi:long-chain acyl-CoA synthetase
VVHTGDLGELDDGGRLRLLGRKKEIIVSAHGHNVAPAKLESALQDACPLILIELFITLWILKWANQ